MKSMTPDEVSAWDLRTTSYHEAAHVVVARHLGYGADAALWPSGTADAVEEKTWTGRMCFSPLPLSVHDRRMIGLAGEVATLLLRDPDLHPQEVEDFLMTDNGSISETDTDLIDGCAYEDIEACIDLVRALWAEIEAEAEQLQRRAEELRKVGESE